MAQDDSPFKDVYIWRSTIIMAGVYLFFLTERLLKMIMNYRRVSTVQDKDFVSVVQLVNVEG